MQAEEFQGSGPIKPEAVQAGEDKNKPIQIQRIIIIGKKYNYDVSSCEVKI
jgi:hypothetical protein